MSDHRYKLTYTMTAHEEGLLKKELPPGGDVGACDAMLICSIIYQEDGSVSMALMSKDGRTDEPLSSLEIFKIWTMLSGHLKDAEDLSLPKRGLAMFVLDTIREALAEARGVGSQET